MYPTLTLALAQEHISVLRSQAQRNSGTGRSRNARWTHARRRDPKRSGRRPESSALDG